VGFSFLPKLSADVTRLRKESAGGLMTYKLHLRSISPSYGGPVAEWRGGLPRRSADPAKALKEAEAVVGEFCRGAVKTCPQRHATAPQRTVLK